MQIKKIFVSTSSFAEFDLQPRELLEKAKLSVEFNPYGRTLTKAEIVLLANQAEGLISGTEFLDREVLGKLERLKVISRCGAGVDNIDITAAKEKGIIIFSTPDGPTLAVAELTLGLMLALLRKIPMMDRNMRLNTWSKEIGNLLYDKQVGIIGFGRIGRKVACLVSAFGAHVSFCDPLVDTNEMPLYPRLEFDAILKTSDIVTLHLPYAKENVNLFDKAEFSLMKQGAFLINCSRGGIVNESALCSALKDGKLAGAAIDVFDKEPYNGLLKEYENVILTPHVGSYAKEARVHMEIEAVQNLINGLQGLAE